MRLTWQYGQRLHGDLTVKWQYHSDEHQYGPATYYRIWNRKTGIIILSILVRDDVRPIV